ncbi:MAG: hypothetical protein JJT96_14220 [Opitutales bacterium]|nr:hypothetical protein [Opitutales bacterium]
MLLSLPISCHRRYLSVVLSLGLASSLQGAIVITSVSTTLDTATSFSQTVPGAGSSSFGSDTNYTINFGVQGDLRMTGFAANSTNFTVNTNLLTNVFLRRNSAQLSGVTPNHQIAWYRATDTNYSSGDTRNVQASFVPTLEALLGGNIINRGTDNMFENTGNNSGNNNNIERADFIFSGNDALTPQNQAHLDGVGFTILERGGNDPIYVSAILGINGSQVTNLSQPVLVAAGDWGNTDLWPTGDNRTLVLRDTAVAGEYRPSDVTPDSQRLVGLYFSLETLGVSVGDTVYGYAIMAGDTNMTIAGADLDRLLDWNDAEIFPTNTTSANGGLDLVSGGSAFIQDGLDTDGLFVAIPEPSVFGLVAALGAFGYVFVRRRRMR